MEPKLQLSLRAASPPFYFILPRHSSKIKNLITDDAKLGLIIPTIHKRSQWFQNFTDEAEHQIPAMLSIVMLDQDGERKALAHHFNE